MRPGRLVWALLALASALVARRRLDAVEVRGRSMAPALLPGDRLLVVRAGAIRAGQVVLARDPRDARRELVKRVAAVANGSVTLRGDNPAYSTDARAFGDLPASDVRWRAVLRYWPLERFGPVPAAIDPTPVIDEGGEAACAFPQALVAGHPRADG